MQTKSRRARRMERHHKIRKASPLNLVSLMDIFTILVFFLLVNSSNAPQLPTQKDLELPTSTAKKVPEETLVLVITPESLLLQGEQIASVAQLNESPEPEFAPLVEALQNQKRRTGTNRAEGEGRAITLMGDENLPYALLAKVLASLQAADYTEIAFAAHQKAKQATPE